MQSQYICAECRGGLPVSVRYRVDELPTGLGNGVFIPDAKDDLADLKRLFPEEMPTGYRFEYRWLPGEGSGLPRLQFGPVKVVEAAVEEKGTTDEKDGLDALTDAQLREKAVELGSPLPKNLIRVEMVNRVRTAMEKVKG